MQQTSSKKTLFRMFDLGQKVTVIVTVSAKFVEN